MKFTNSSVMAIPTPTGRQSYTFDDTLAGFGVRANPGGRKSYFVQYRFGGTKRRMTLGPTTILSAEVARQRAKELLARVALGEDPDAEPTMTLEAAWAWWTSTVLVHRSASYQRSAAVVWRHHIPRALKRRVVTEITRSDLLAVCEALIDRPPTATLTLKILSALFARLADREVVPRNPLTRAHLDVTLVARDRVLLDDELKSVWFAAARLGGLHGLAVHTLILTACRREEVFGLTWSEVTEGVIRLRAERTKTSAPLTLHLPPDLAARIASLPREGDNVFGRIDAGSLLARLRANVDVSDWRFHDLRRTAATNMARLGVAPHVVERVLNHRSSRAGNSGVAGVYNRHSYEAEVGAALALHESWVLGLVRPTLVASERR